MEENVSVCWLRRDLRLFDNAALFHALQSKNPVLVFFIFDSQILHKLEDRKDRRVNFIYQQLERLNRQLQRHGSSLVVKYGVPKKAFLELLSEYRVQDVFTNRDYEPYATERDSKIGALLAEKHISFHTFKDQVIFEKDEIIKSDGTPYTVFTPYSNKWKQQLAQEDLPVYASEEQLDRLLKMPKRELPSLQDIGFEPSEFFVPEADLSESLIENYHGTRNLPAVKGTTYAGVHLRFGTLSVRQLVTQARQQNEVWLNELIWREFFMMILWHFPEVVDHNFRRKYDRLQWRNNEEEFARWCRGETGFPLVDAGMRQLNQTGWMHNRVRMLVAGFLTKHLLIDWRWGEAYFAEKLLDYELASNNGNWQWAAGTGCDAAPYFRIFNPETQLKKFDPDLKYVKKWIENFRAGYIEPIVDHKFARARALETYKKALNG